MRLYLDTSALLKLYVEEDDSDFVEGAVQDAETTVTSIMTYVETRAAFSRRRRDGSLTLADYHRVVREFEREWERYFVIPVTDSLIKSAGKLAETHGLRGYDALHLASRITSGRRPTSRLSSAVGIPVWKPQRDDKDFSFFDRCSNLAAFTKLNS